MIKRRAGISLAFLLLLTGLGCTTSRSHQKVASTKLAREMVGTWVMVGTPGRVSEPPERGGRFKYRTGTHWIVISVNGETGLVTENFGGTYTMDDDQYIETQDYADYRWKGDNGKSFTFKVKIDDNEMTQLGVGNPYNEVWKRVR